MKKQQYTPVIQQYLDIKKDYQDAIVFFRLGDFYEMFFDDAIIASKVLEIALTSRDGENKIPMCGVPYHAAPIYLQKLIENGFRVAIAEQVTEPTGRGLVKREVVKYITPGMVLEDGILDQNRNNYIAGIILKEFGYIITLFDISTGEGFQKSNLSLSELKDEIDKYGIKEAVLEHDRDKLLTTWLKDKSIYYQTYDKTIKTINQRLTTNLDDLEQKRAATHLINFLDEQQKQPLKHYQAIELIKTDEYMLITANVDKQLELTSSIQGDKNTLFYHLNNTNTAVGARMLKNYMSNPLKNKEEILKRQNYVSSIMQLSNLGELKEALSAVYDLSRIMGRVAFRNSNARDLVQLKNTLGSVPVIKEILLNSNIKILEDYANKLDDHSKLYNELTNALIDNPPITVKEGGMIKKGYNNELDELLLINEDVSSWFNQFEQDLRAKTNIKTLKIGFNRVFGYFIEVTKGNIPLIKDEFNFKRVQTLVNAERYTSSELEEKEKVISNAESRQLDLEYEIFNNLREEVFTHLTSLQNLSNKIAEIDVYYSFAKVALENNYIKPEISDTHQLNIVGGRHPVVEKYTKYIKNNANIKDGQITLITGPNMSGKSTYMRMIAIISYMMQIGSFVSADEAIIPIYDAIYTRIGAYDDLAGGRSTFMVEMAETNDALKNATNKSLILFDEIGRGTSTYDGMALAYAIINYIHHSINAHTLFSTHYHELTKLSNDLENLVNVHVKASLDNRKMVFYHLVEDGPTDRSYGIQVAMLAGLPDVLINNANDFLMHLEQNGKDDSIDLFTYSNIPLATSNNSREETEIINELSSINPDEMTPLDALIKIKYWQNQIKDRLDDEDGEDDE